MDAPCAATRHTGQAPRDRDHEGALYGAVLVFAATIGCTVGDSVTKKTTLLVVGDQDVTRPAGRSKSVKHRWVEGLITSSVPPV
jgi:DNA polymerase-3 subunit epsilon